MKNGHEHYLGWTLIVQVASKCPERGVLADDDGPLDAEDLHLKTDCPKEIFTAAFTALCEVGWLERVDDPELATQLLMKAGCANFPIRRESNDLRDNGEVSSGYAGSPSGCATTASGLQDRTRQDIQDKTVTDCSEPATPASEPPAAVLTFPIVGKAKTWDLTAGKLAEYLETYPGLDVLAQCRGALQWCRDNPTKRKTAGGMAGFLTRWLNREQNKGRGRATDPPAEHRATTPAVIEDREPLVFELTDAQIDDLHGPQSAGA